MAEKIPNTAPKPDLGSQPTSTHSRVGGRQLVILFVLALTLAIIIIDTTIVSVALPNIQSSFSVTVNNLEWISSLYALIFGAFILTWGKLSDQFGRRRVLMIGIGLFVAGSTLVGVSNGLGVMLVGRAIQGFGAAMAMPSTLSILTVTFVGRARALAFGIWGATAGADGCDRSHTRRLLRNLRLLALGIPDQHSYRNNRSGWGACGYQGNKLQGP